MDAIREFERETQLLLQQRFGGSEGDNGDGDNADGGDNVDGRAAADNTGMKWTIGFWSREFNVRFKRALAWLSIDSKPYIRNFVSLATNTARPSADLATHSAQFQSIEKTEETPMFPKRLPQPPQLQNHPASIDDSSEDDDNNITAIANVRKERSASGQLSQRSRLGSRHGLHSPSSSSHNFDLQVNLMWNLHMKQFLV